MMCWTDDPAMDEMRYTQRQEDELERYPKCDCCGEIIQDDHFFIIDDEYICQNCLEENYMRNTEDYIE